MDDKTLFFSKDIYDYLERSMIPMGICYAENGKFQAHIISEGICRMYHSTREEMLARLNGPDPFVNIVEKDEMLEAVRAFSVDNAPYDVVFHEHVGADRKLITVHCTGYHEYTKDGRRYSILLYDEVSDTVRRNLFKEERETQMTLLAGLSCEYEAIWLVDADIHHGKLIRSNMGNTRSAEKMNSMNDGNYEVILENYIEQYVVPRDRERMYAETSIDSLLRNTRENELYHVNYLRVNEEGKKNYMQLVYSRVIDDTGVTRFVCGFRNIDEVIAEEKKKNALYYMAHIDSMTKLGNRRAFDEFMDSYADRKPEDELIFFCFDLNELKSINDKHGHEAGDELISGAALCMRRAFGKSGNIFRTGGDEFAAIITCDTGSRDEVVEGLTEYFNSWKGKLGQQLSISMGYVSFDENPDMTIDDMRKEAEKRMYKNKSDYYLKQGKDRRKT